MKKTFAKSIIVMMAIAFAVSAVVVGILRYFLLPAITFASGDFWFYLFLAFVVFAINLGICTAISWDDDVHDTLVKICGGSVAVSVIWILVCIGVGIASGKMVNAARYQQIISVENENSFENDFKDITENSEINIAIVDLETAKMVGNRTIGNIPHASWYEVDDEFNLIKYQGNYYRISPLNYGGYFKYNKANASGLPGYVLVDAKTAEAKYCELEEPFFYSPSSFWSKDLERHLRSQYPSKQFTSSYFEIDEEGKAYWITPVYESTIGVWGGKKETSVIVTNATTGQSTEYSIDDTPNWIDHNFGLNYFMDTVQYHYSFVDGYWNSVVSKTGVYNLAYTYKSDKADEGYFEGYTSVIGKDGEVYFYSGLTPANNSESNAGFVMMNCRTGKVSQFNYDGSNAAEESSAQSAAESLVQNYGFQATFPIIVNVGGEETYLMTLKDKAGLVQRYAFCNVQNYSVVVQNETLEGALADYLSKLGKTDVANNMKAENVETKTKSSTIEAVYSAEIDGTTVFYYKFRNDNKLYKASIVVNELQVTFDVGNRVLIEYVESESDIIDILSIK